MEINPSQKEKTIIFDFDHTLFDTELLKPILKDFYIRRGVPEKMYDEVMAFQRKRDGNFGMKEIWEEINKLGHSIPKENLEAFFNSNLSSYLKGPVKETLQKLQERGYELMILSMGIDDFQRWKIHQAGIEHFFGNHIYTCSKDKPSEMKKIPAKGEVYFVNDHVYEIEEMVKAFPSIHPIYVKGPKYSHDHFIDQKHIPTITDISELLEILA